jgi:AraC-like DNA-binding protein
MKSIQVEKFNPSQGISFDITVYNSLQSVGPNVFKVHEEYELTVLYNCSGKRIVGNSIHNFYEEDMFLLGPNLPHSLIVDNPEKSHAVCIHFTEESFGQNFFDTPQNSSISKLLAKVSLGCHFYGPEVVNIKEQIKTIKDLEPFRQMMCFIDVLYQLSNVKDYTLLSSPGYQPAVKRKEAKRMSLIYDYILENFDKKLTLEELSELINVSPATFCRLFKKSMNMNFTDFVAEVRIGHACKILMDTDLSIAEVCFLSGYNHMTHFNKKFKQLMGKSPKQYRNGFQ